MSKRRFGYTAAGLAALALSIFIWQVPNILRAIPSRYVALMPEPIQALGVREHVERLPTPAVQVDTAALLAQLPTSTPTSQPTLAPAIVTEPTNPAAPPTATLNPTPSPTIPPTPTPIPYPASARLASVAHQFQSWNNCGPATLAMGLSAYEIYLRQQDTAAWLKPDPEDRNVSPHEMVAYVKENTGLDAIDRANGTLAQIRQLLSSDIPVIIETGIDPPGEFRWMEWYGHYLLVVGYDDEQELVWVYDSWLGSGIDENLQPIATPEGRPVPYAEFDRYWRQFNRHYIAIFPPEKSGLVTDIVGPQMDDQVMWQAALDRNLIELGEEPENAYLWFNLGTSYNGLGDYEAAAGAFDQARLIGLPWRMLWYQFGPYEAYLQIGRYQDVIDLADVTLHQRPYFEESYYYRGLAFQALGDSRRAAQDFNRATSFNPRFTQAQEALAGLDG